MEQTSKNLIEILESGQKGLDVRLENHRKAVEAVEGRLLFSEKTRKKLFILCVGNLIALLIVAGLFFFI